MEMCSTGCVTKYLHNGAIRVNAYHVHPEEGGHHPEVYDKTCKRVINYRVLSDVKVKMVTKDRIQYKIHI